MRWLDHIIGICVHFKKLLKITKLVSKWLHRFPPAAYESSSCSTSSATLMIVNLLDLRHSNDCAVESHFLPDTSLMTDVEQIFMSVNDHLDLFLLKCLENNSLVIRDMLRFVLKGVLQKVD